MIYSNPRQLGKTQLIKMFNRASILEHMMMDVTEIQEYINALIEDAPHQYTLLDECVLYKAILALDDLPTTNQY